MELRLEAFDMAGMKGIKDDPQAIKEAVRFERF